MNKLNPLSTNTLDYVKDFYNMFGVPYWGSPEWPEENIARLRLGLVQEELKEVVEAVNKKDMVNLLKELTDLQYVVDGLYLTFGLDRVKIIAMREVHKSNITKLGPGNTVIRNPAGKIMKGPGYKAPDLTWLVAKNSR